MPPFWLKMALGLKGSTLCPSSFSPSWLQLHPFFVTWFLHPTLPWPTSCRQGPGHSHSWPGDHLAGGWLRDLLLGWEIASTEISHCFNCQQQSGGGRCSLAIKGASPCWGARLAAEIVCVIFSAWTQRCQKRMPSWKAACPRRAGLQGLVTFNSSSLLLLSLSL